MTTPKPVNNLGTFYTNLGKTATQQINSVAKSVNTAATNVKNSLKNIVQNSPKTINSMLPAKTNSSSGIGFFSGLAPASANAATATNSEKPFHKWGWPLVLFIIITTLCIIIFFKYKEKIKSIPKIQTIRIIYEFSCKIVF